MFGFGREGGKEIKLSFRLPVVQFPGLFAASTTASSTTRAAVAVAGLSKEFLCADVDLHNMSTLPIEA